MKYVIMNKEEGWLYSENGKVVEFDDAYECVRYFKKNELDEEFMIVVENIDKDKNVEFKKYL